jgi:hypothetical protein
LHFDFGAPLVFVGNISDNCHIDKD